MDGCDWCKVGGVPSRDREGEGEVNAVEADERGSSSDWTLAARWRVARVRKEGVVRGMGPWECGESVSIKYLGVR
jgi:hypothetical protein